MNFDDYEHAYAYAHKYLKEAKIEPPRYTGYFLRDWFQKEYGETGEITYRLSLNDVEFFVHDGVAQIVYCYTVFEAALGDHHESLLFFNGVFLRESEYQRLVAAAKPEDFSFYEDNLWSATHWISFCYTEDACI